MTFVLSHRLLSVSISATATLLVGNAVKAQHAVDAINGVDAVAVLGDRLPALARRHGMAPAELATLLQSDTTLWLGTNDRLVYIDTAIPGVEHDPADVPVALAGIELENAFLLQTDPGADRTIYLDFDGHHSVNNAWGHDIEFPEYNIDGFPDFHTDGELEQIIAIWQHVAEDFAPFGVNVTTMDPGLAALTRSNGGDQTYGVRCLMTQATDGFGNGIGGVAFLNSFDDSSDNPVFVFNKGDNNGSMSASHEVGHALGLSHDGVGGSNYHPGTGSGVTSWGPIMGAPFGKNLVQWSDGDYPDATNTQNDYAFILGYLPTRPDLYSDTLVAATPLDTGCTPSIAGIIGTPTDVDVFSFTTAAGSVLVIGVPSDPGPNLDIQLTLYDDAGVEVTSVNPPNSVQAVLSTTLAAGQYFAEIDGIGKPDVYTDYGSLGSYTITLVLPVCGCVADIDGDGTVGIQDFLDLLGAWGPCLGCSEDLNGDHTVGISDLLDLLGAWGACP
jgi:hypothetical protein